MNDIILFDGVCNFCNGTINFIIKRDGHNNFSFASLQGTTAESLQEKFGFNRNRLESIIVLHGDKSYNKSSAVLYICKIIYPKFSWFFSLMFYIPLFIRDGAYNYFAKRRYWFGTNYCMIPSIETRDKFLP